MRSILLAGLTAGLLGAAPAQGASIAITEYLADPSGRDATGEWVELFNYGSRAVSLDGWQLGDEDRNQVTLSGLTVDPGAYLVLARDPAAFAEAWGVDSGHPGLAGMPSGFSLANGGDELVLGDAVGDRVWRVAYGTAGAPTGSAVYLDPDSGFDRRDYGSKAAPGVVLGGPDFPGIPGYEACVSGAHCPDARVSGLGDRGSPLGGGHAAVPGPPAMALMAAGLGVLVPLLRPARKSP